MEDKNKMMVQLRNYLLLLRILVYIIDLSVLIASNCDFYSFYILSLVSPLHNGNNNKPRKLLTGVLQLIKV